jgi:hypothetical protein
VHNRRWHEGETCAQFDYRTDGTQRRAEEKASEKLIKGTAKKCPGCKGNVEKISGCDHMTCGFPVGLLWMCADMLQVRNADISSAGLASLPMARFVIKGIAGIRRLVSTTMRRSVKRSDDVCNPFLAQVVPEATTRRVRSRCKKRPKQSRRRYARGLRSNKSKYTEDTLAGQEATKATMQRAHLQS